MDRDDSHGVFVCGLLERVGNHHSCQFTLAVAVKEIIHQNLAVMRDIYIFDDRSSNLAFFE